jgi:hypothetical protein
MAPFSSRSTRILRVLGCWILFAAILAVTVQPSQRIDAADGTFPSELAIIPSDSAAFISIRFGEIWQNDAIKPVRELFAKEKVDVFTQVEKTVGLKLDTIERVSIVIPAFGIERRGEPGMVFLVTTTKPYDPEKVLSAMHAYSPSEFQNEPALKSNGIIQDVPKIIEIPQKIKAPPPALKRFEKKPPIKESDLPNGGGDGDDPIVRRNNKRDLSASFYISPRNQLVVYLVNPRTIAIIPSDDRSGTVFALLGQLLKQNPKGNLSSSLVAASGKSHIVAGLDLSSLSQFLGNNLPDLMPGKTLLSARSVTFLTDLGTDAQLTLRFDCADTATAKKVEETAKALLILGKEVLPSLKKELLKDESMKPFAEVFTQLETAIQNATCEIQDTQVHVTVKAKSDVLIGTSLATLVLRIQQAAQRTVIVNNFKQVALAVHNYHDAMGQMPFPAIGKNGLLRRGDTPLLSWRVAILPYIEQDNLYRQFKLDEPWDSEHNLKLLPSMPKIYAPHKGTKVEAGHTFVQIFTGPEAMGIGMRIPASFPDGTSNTIMVTESGTSVPWTKPDDIPFDSKKDLPKLGASFGDQLIIALCDGSVSMIDMKKVKEKTLKLAIQRSDATPFNWED